MSAAAIAIIVVVAVVVLVVAAMAVTRRRLQQRFGPEYDRVVEQHGQFRATAELARRERRVQRLRIRPLTTAARAEYAAEWKTIQEGFVDQPQHAVIEGQDLLASVMKERGYPAEDPGQIEADLSVTQAGILDHYRAARRIVADADGGDASTEDLRQALIHVRAVFAEVLGEPEAEEPQELPQAGPQVLYGAGPELEGAGPRHAGAGRGPDGAGRRPDGAGPRPGGSGGRPDDAPSPAPKEQLWRPVPVPPARASDEEAAQ
jgi:hypothetical protein